MNCTVCLLRMVSLTDWPGLLAGDLSGVVAAQSFSFISSGEFWDVLAEALACGLPVSISDSVNISSDVATAGAGIVHPASFLGTTAAQSVFHMSHIARHQMSSNANKLFYSKFNFASVVRHLVPVLSASLN